MINLVKLCHLNFQIRIVSEHHLMCRLLLVLSLFELAKKENEEEDLIEMEKIVQITEHVYLFNRFILLTFFAMSCHLGINYRLLVIRLDLLVP